ncbi:MAG TPA: SRPBCC family protein [Nocardioidaceae bacterium]|nr:SRPBCC family protein [Nocardioidaceae bacterium]
MTVTPGQVVDQTLDVGVDAKVLWDFITDWKRHGDWIPLTRVDLVGGPAREVGGVFRTRSGVGPLGFWDPLRVTAWDEWPDGGGTCTLVHTGKVVRGDAEITVTPLGEGRSRLRWVEHFEFGRPGRLAWRVGGRLVDRGLGRLLRRAAAIVEAG